MWIVSCMLKPNIYFLQKWKDRGYKLAIRVDNQRNVELIKPFTDLVVTIPYAGIADTTNNIVKLLPSNYKMVLFICEEAYPDSNHTTEDVEKIFLSNFPDTFGVMGAKSDLNHSYNTIWFPIVGRKWIEQYNFWPSGYKRYYCDTELTLRAKKLGKIFIDNNIKYLHSTIYTREGLPHRPDTSCKEYKLDRELFESRKGFI